MSQTPSALFIKEIFGAKKTDERDEEEAKKILKDYFGYDERSIIERYYDDYPFLSEDILFRMAEIEAERQNIINQINAPLLSRQERRKLERKLYKQENKEKLKKYKNRKKKREKKPLRPLEKGAPQIF